MYRKSCCSATSSSFFMARRWSARSHVVCAKSTADDQNGDWCPSLTHAKMTPGSSRSGVKHLRTSAQAPTIQLAVLPKIARCNAAGFWAVVTELILSDQLHPDHPENIRSPQLTSRVWPSPASDFCHRHHISATSRPDTSRLRSQRHVRVSHATQSPVQPAPVAA